MRQKSQETHKEKKYMYYFWEAIRGLQEQEGAFFDTSALRVQGVMHHS